MPIGTSRGAEDNTDPRKASQDSRPVPDPTVLTTEAVAREIKHLQILLETQIADGLRNREHQIQGINSLLEEKFKGVDLQFALVERQRVEQKGDTKQAVDAALTAQKEAVREQTIASDKAIEKSESGTSKQLDQLGSNFKAEIAGLTGSIGDLKERIGSMETRRETVQETKVERGGSDRFVLAIAALVVSIVLGALGFLVARPAATTPTSQPPTVITVPAPTASR